MISTSNIMQRFEPTRIKIVDKCLRLAAKKNLMDEEKDIWI